ncbi:hypothetical protein V8E54_013747 [Elaphomyces granulatus]
MLPEPAIYPQEVINMWFENGQRIRGWSNDVFQATGKFEEIDREPPPELLKLIWPELDGFLKVRDAEQLDPVKRIPEHRLCLAGAGFANLLQQFRRYLLQDSAILRPMFPTHPIWARDVFRHPLYAPFAERVRFQHSNC